MNQISKLLTIIILSATLSIASISYADKVKVKVHGGTWEYGYGWNNAYSNYKHDHKNHGTKVVNPNNGIKNFRNAGPGVWTKASIGTLWDPATFYYNPSGFYSY